MIINHHNTQEKVYIIAELSANHNNDLDLALKTVREMAKSGADAVKVQTFTADSMTLDLDDARFQTRKDSLWSGQKLFDLYAKGSLPYDWHEPLKKEANRHGMDFFSSPFDIQAVDFLESLEVPAYKVASLEINHIPLIKHIASKKKPIIFSSGVATKEDLRLAISTSADSGNKELCVLKCTTAYPTLPEESELSQLIWLKNELGVEVGLSDHSMSPFIPSISVALGARIIEKHFILNRSYGGIDSKFSLEPEEFRLMVKGVRETEKSLGSHNYELGPKGKAARKSMRSIIVSKKILKGKKLDESNCSVLRPGIGMHPKYFEKIIGLKVNKDLNAGHPLHKDDIADFEDN